MKRLLLLLGVVLALAAGCTIETATAPTGSLTLYADFDDAADLTAGHFVQASNVVIGSVTKIELDGYRAKATLSIVDGHDIPVGTQAVIKRTSLLGEHYVDLVFPTGFDPDEGPFLQSGDSIDQTDTQADLEDLAGDAASIVGAITADDVAGIVHAGAQGLDGRGQVLNQLIANARQVADALAHQQSAIDSAIDDAGSLGAALAPESDEIGTLLDNLASVTGTVAGDRDKLVQTLRSVLELASSTTNEILVPHADRLVTLLDQLRPIVTDLAGRSDVLAGLVTDLLRFTELLPTAIHDGTILLLTWAFLDVPILDDLAAPGQDPLDALIDLLRGGGGG